MTDQRGACAKRLKWSLPFFFPSAVLDHRQPLNLNITALTSQSFDDERVISRQQVF